MRASQSHEAVPLTIQTVAGTGSASFAVEGRLARFSITPPDNHAYNVELLDEDGDGIFIGPTGLIGKFTGIVEQPCINRNYVNISFAASGIYLCKLVIWRGL